HSRRRAASQFRLRLIPAQDALAIRATPATNFHLLRQIQRARRRRKSQFRIVPVALLFVPFGYVVAGASALLPGRTRNQAPPPAFRSALIRRALPAHQRNLPSWVTRFCKSS